MIKRSSNPWKKWGLVGFVLCGAGYAGTMLFGNIEFVDDLGLYWKIVAGTGSAVLGCALSSCAATIRYRRQRVEINNRDLMNTLLNSDVESQSNRVISSHYLIEHSLKDPTSHANACSNLVNDFNRELAVGEVDVEEYIIQAEHLKKEFLKRHPNDINRYLLILKSNGYIFQEEPREIFSKKPKQATTSIQVQITPVTSPPETPTKMFYKNSQTNDDDLDNSRSFSRSTTI